MAGTQSRVTSRPWEADVESMRHDEPIPVDTDSDPARMSLEIARTRQKMDRTIDELRLRLSDVSQSVRNTAVNSMLWAGVGMAAVAGLWIGFKVKKGRMARLAAARPVGFFATLRDRFDREKARRKGSVLKSLACRVRSLLAGRG